MSNHWTTQLLAMSTALRRWLPRTRLHDHREPASGVSCAGVWHHYYTMHSGRSGFFDLPHNTRRRSCTSIPFVSLVQLLHQFFERALWAGAHRSGSDWTSLSHERTRFIFSAHPHEAHVWKSFFFSLAIYQLTSYKTHHAQE